MITFAKASILGMASVNSFADAILSIVYIFVVTLPKESREAKICIGNCDKQHILDTNAGKQLS